VTKCNRDELLPQSLLTFVYFLTFMDDTFSKMKDDGTNEDKINENDDK